MKYYIKGISESYTASDTIVDLCDFILGNKGYLYVFSEIIRSGNIADKSGRGRFVDLIIKEAALSKVIFYDADLITKFRELLCRFFLCDSEDSGNTRGKAFEYLIYHAGPICLDKDLKNICIKRKCFVEDKDGSKVGGENNFDFGFYNSNKDLTPLDVELLECKINLKNFLCSKFYQLSFKAEKKLKFMNAVAKCLITCKRRLVAFITLLPSTRIYINILKEKGYCNVVILSYGDIEKAFNRKFYTDYNGSPTEKGY